MTEQVGELTSLEPVKTRPWATVWRAETPNGVFFAKQNCAPQSFEAALLTELVSLVPDAVVPLAVTDLERGLILTPDQGPVFGSVVDQDIDAWSRMLAAAAQLQRDVAPYADRLERAGAVPLRPSETAVYVGERLGGFAALAEDDPRRVPTEQLDALRDLVPQVERWAEQVGELGLPLTLCHNDLHGNNVFDRDGQLRFFDFADAMLMEPLANLLIPLNVLKHGLDAEPDDPRLWKVADAALGVWTDMRPLSVLREALPAALQLAKLARAESWIRCTAPMDDGELAEWGDSGAYWLGALLDPPPLRRLED
ncbi:phosphotransferase [Nocardioides sp.]|uniref:phosphotransferase n=1 Tax=Nocardioides sp. TaxID=35761 RepID=UPI003561696A